tara:strand:- start:4473 stop:5135 length:663 start_codon:yes stop_codon:yes gene_type:complete
VPLPAPTAALGTRFPGNFEDDLCVLPDKTSRGVPLRADITGTRSFPRAIFLGAATFLGIRPRLSPAPSNIAAVSSILVLRRGLFDAGFNRLCLVQLAALSLVALALAGLALAGLALGFRPDAGFNRPVGLALAALSLVALALAGLALAGLALGFRPDAGFNRPVGLALAGLALGFRPDAGFNRPVGLALAALELGFRLGIGAVLDFLGSSALRVEYFLPL